MVALRALLFAVFGGFIGAAPAAPVAPDRTGQDTDVAEAPPSQKSEQHRCRTDAPQARDRAAAPPSTDVPGGSSALPASAPHGAPHRDAAVPVPSGATAAPPPPEDVRAGLLGLPPPPR